MNVEAFKITPTSTFVKVRGLQTEAPHIPLSIIAAIDVSGSMEGERLEYVKNSLNHMVPMMTAEDSFSLIAFSDAATIHCENVALNTAGVSTVQNIIENLTTISSTNMGSALIAARDIVSRTPCNKKVCILLLTDGHVNMGINDETALNALANSIRDVSRPAPPVGTEMAPSSISLFAVGYGVDHNFTLLQSFARDGGGSYQVVNSLEHVATVFGDMLGGMQTIVAQNAEILLAPGAKALTGLRTTSTGVQLGDIYAGAQNSLIIDNMPVAVDNTAQSINYRYFDVTTMTLVSGSCVISLESGPEIIREGTLFTLKQNMAALMNRIATGVIPHADLGNQIQSAIDELRPYAATEPWVNTMMINFERQIRLIDRMGAAYASRGISGIAANNAAVLATNRGVAMMSQDPDDMNAHTSADMFSTPAQRHVSGGIVRGVSGGYAMHPPARSGLSGDMASLGLVGPYPPPMPPLPIRGRAGGGLTVPLPPMTISRQVGGAGGQVSQASPLHDSASSPKGFELRRGQVPPPIEIPPPPTISELEATDSAPSTPRNQIRTVNQFNPPPAPRRQRVPSPSDGDGEPSPKRSKVTFKDDEMH